MLQGPLFQSPYNGSAWFDYNLYYNLSAPTEPLSDTFPSNATGTDMACAASLSQWQHTGMDVHSIVANPLFRNASAFDYEVASTSPALRLGFQRL